MVRGSITDGQVADWVQSRAAKSDAEKQIHRETMLDYPKADDPAGQGHRDDIRLFVDFIDADEKRI